MTVFTCRSIALACALVVSGAAQAQTPAAPAASPNPAQAAKPAAPAPVPAPTGAAGKPASPAAVAPAAGSSTTAKPAAAAAPAQPAMSESKYLSLLYSEISRHTPEDNPSGPGEVTASFVVGPSGKVEKVTIDKTTSPAHAEIVKKILSQVVTPPPPGGSMDVGQTFKFR